MAVLVYDYSLTFGDETTFLWRSRRLSAAHATYFAARYCGIASAFLSLFSSTREFTILIAVLMCITTISANAIFAVRTYALWFRNRFATWFLLGLTIVLLAPFTTLVARELAQEKSFRSFVTSLITPATHCNDHDVAMQMASSLRAIPALSCILYNTVNLILSLIIIARWRRSVHSSGSASTHLINMLWKDGFVYAITMLALSLFNVVLHAKLQYELRSAGYQIQTNLHSILSTRIVLHLACAEKSLDGDSTIMSNIRFTTRPVTAIITEASSA